MPRIKLRAQTAESFTEGVVFCLGFYVKFTRLLQARFLPFDNFTRIGQFTLGMMPVIAIPLTQDHFKICLCTPKFNGAFCLTLQTA